MTPLAVLAQTPTPEQIREAVRDVLSRAEYAQASSEESLIDRGLGWLLEGLGRLLARLSGFGGGAGSWLGAAGLVLLTALLVALTVRVVRRFRSSSVADPVVDGPTGRRPRDWGEEAVAHARNGELREALRCRYRETVALLADAGYIDEIPGRTTGEYLAAASEALPAATDAFGRLTRAFEKAWYGRRAVDAEGYAAAEAAQREVIDAGRLRRAVANRDAVAAGAGS